MNAKIAQGQTLRSPALKSREPRMGDRAICDKRNLQSLWAIEKTSLPMCYWRVGHDSPETRRRHAWAITI